MEETAPETSTVPCPHCGAQNPADQRFCHACGGELRGRPSSGRRRARGDAAERAQGRHEFGRIKSVVLTVRSVFWASVVLAAMQLLLWAVAREKLAAVADGADGWLAWIGLALAGELALMLAGALLVLRAPLLWTVVAASWWTLTTAITLWWTDFAVPPSMLMRLFLLVCFWFAVAQAARVQRLMAADPSLQLVRKRIDPAKRVVGGVADDARERRREQRRAVWLGRLRLAAIVVVGIVIAWFAIGRLNAPPGPDDVIARFGKSWQSGDAAAIAGDLADAGLPARLRDDLARRGYGPGSMPPLGAPQVEAEEDRAMVTYPMLDQTVRATFVLTERRWSLVGVDLPPLQPTELAPAVAAFRAAWAAKGTDGLLALLRPESRDRLGGRLQRLLTKLDWHERRPALGADITGKPQGGRAKVVFAIDNDEVVVNFEYWAPSWRVASLTLPRE